MHQKFELVHNPNSNFGMGNRNEVRGIAGYSKGNTRHLALSDDLALMLMYISNISTVQCNMKMTAEKDYLYNTADTKQWTNLNVSKKFYTDKLADLVTAGYINIVSRTKFTTLYHIPEIPLEISVRIPHLFLYSQKLTWAHKKRLYKLILVCQKKGIQSITFNSTKDKSRHPILEQTKDKLSQLFADLRELGFLSSGNVISTEQILLDVSVEVHRNALVDSARQEIKIKSLQGKTNLQAKELKVKDEIIKNLSATLTEHNIPLTKINK